MPPVDYLTLPDDLDDDAVFFAEADAAGFATFGGVADELLSSAAAGFLDTPTARAMTTACAEKARVGAKEGIIEAAQENWPWLIVGALALATAQFAISSIGTALLLGRRF